MLRQLILQNSSTFYEGRSVKYGNGSSIRILSSQISVVLFCHSQKFNSQKLQTSVANSNLFHSKKYFQVAEAEYRLETLV